MQDNQSAAGQLMIDYNENQNHLDALRYRIGELAENLIAVGQQVGNRASARDVVLQEATIEFTDYNRRSHSVSVHSLTELFDLLKRRQALMECKTRLEECMRQAGLDRFIQE